jgi:hypothetical protein
MAKRKKHESKNWTIIIALLVVAAIALFALNFYLSSQIRNIPQQESTSMMGMPMSRMKFTEFDKQKAREFMDKNNDGKCDICGMPMDQCIASGMMQCSGMDPDATMGVLGSQHIHADWKVYFDGKEFDWTPYVNLHERQMKGEDIKDTSAFMHMHPDAGEPAGAVLHMHATGIPLHLFFDSLGMAFDKDCIIIDNNKHCGIKLYVNGKENNALGNYVFNDLDKMLITDGKGNVGEQLKSMTNFAEAH